MSAKGQKVFKRTFLLGMSQTSDLVGNSKSLPPLNFSTGDQLDISLLLLIQSRNLSLGDNFFHKTKSGEGKERQKSVSHLVGDLFNVFSVSGNSLV